MTLDALQFSDTLPAGLVISTPNGFTGSCGGGTITAAAGQQSHAGLGGATLADRLGQLHIFGQCLQQRTAIGYVTNTTTTVSVNGSRGRRGSVR